MRVPHIYLDIPLIVGSTITLSADTHRHVISVLRLKENNQIMLFNGDGAEYSSTIISSDKKITTVLINEKKNDCSTSPINIELALSLIKNDKFDFAIQKSVELGVTTISPLTATRSTVKLDEKRSAKKLLHWQGIIQSACEQSGRNTLPSINPVQSIQQWLESSTTNGIIFEPTSTQRLSSIQPTENIRVIIGPEGGFTEQELEIVAQHNFNKIKLGPRVMRTETAAITAISSLQLLWGDLNI